MKKVITLGSVILGAIFLSGCSLQPASQNNVQAPTVTPNNVPAPVNAPSDKSVPPVSQNSITIQNFAFSPSTITIKSGTKVTWTNNDTVPHTVTSDSGNLLDSSTLNPGQSFSFTFTNTGSTSYHCNIHPMMKGTIIVEN